MVVVISERHGKTIHLNAEALFEQILATDDFVLAPFFIVGPSQLFPASFSAWLNHGDVVPFAQILVGRGMGLNINGTVAKVGELLPCYRVASAHGGTAEALGLA